MSNSSMTAQLAERMAQGQAYWQTGAGRSLWEAQQACLGPLLEGRGGRHALEMGMGPSFTSALAPLGHPIRWSPNRSLAAGASSLVCPHDRLALPDCCMDVVIVHHWLEQLPDAHFTLQEAARVTADTGVLVLFGFNPFSIAGLSRGWRKRQNDFPWSGEWRSAQRLRDWLAFVDFEVERVDYCGFRGLMSATCGERREAWGRRQNLPLGESYMIQAQRRQRHAPIQRVTFGLRTPVPNSLGVTRAGASAQQLSASQRCQQKDSQSE